MVNQTVVHLYHGCYSTMKRTNSWYIQQTGCILRLTLSEKGQYLKFTFYIIPFLKHSWNDIILEMDNVSDCQELRWLWGQKGS